MPHYPDLIKSKLPNVGTSIFSVMSKLAMEYGAINLSQGFPDFNISEELSALVTEAMKKGYNQYAPMPGIPSLREAIAIKTEKLYTANYDPETEITVTSGGTQAIYTAITAVISEGDEVIVFEPAYDCYSPAIQLQGGIPVYIELKFPGYTINWEEVKSRITHKTRMIILNTPHNPGGSVLGKEDIEQLKKITKGTSILILSDEVYEHLIYDNKPHLSMAAYPELAERSFIISSFGKTFHATGWKMGYCLAPKELMIEFRKVHQFLVFSANTPIQHALASYLKDEQHYLGLAAFYQEKRDHFAGLMKQTRFELLPCCGSYFQNVSFKKLSQEKDVDFAKRLTKEFGVASIPNSAFYHEGTDHKVLRFCFAKKKETMEMAVEKLMRI